MEFSNHRRNPWFMALLASIVATSLYIVMDFLETGEVALSRIATFSLVLFIVFFFIQTSLNYSKERQTGERSNF